MTVAVSDLHGLLLSFQESKPDYQFGDKVLVDLGDEQLAGVVLEVREPEVGTGIINAEVAVKHPVPGRSFAYNVLQFWIGHLSNGNDDLTFKNTHPEGI